MNEPCNFQPSARTSAKQCHRLLAPPCSPSLTHRRRFCRTTSRKGNALQACVASMFSQSLSDVPNFVALQCGYEEGIRQYLESNSDSGKAYSYVKKKPGDVVGSDSNRLCILRGKSPRGDFGHVVVARVLWEVSKDQATFEMVHDPHPDGTFLDDSEAYGWCIFFQEA